MHLLERHGGQAEAVHASGGTMTMSAMDRHQQRLEALRKADAIRLRKAELKRELKSGTLPLALALSHEELADWPIGDVLGYCCIGSERTLKSAPLRAPAR